jgi:hypothetical protein
VTVTASSHLPGTQTQRASQAVDGQSGTFWSAAFGEQVGQWIDVRSAAPTTFDHLDLQLVADRYHSVPTQLEVSAGGESRTVDLPAVDVKQGTPRNATVTVPVTFAPLTGDDVKITITKVDPMVTTEYHELTPIDMPVAIAELGLPGVTRTAVPATLPSECRSDLLAIDGAPVATRLVGTSADLLAGKAVDLELCSPDVTLSRGNHVVRSTPGTVTGIDVDGMVLGSAAGGGALALGPGGELPSSALTIPASAVAATPQVKVTDDGRTKIRVHVSGAQPGTPFWLVLGQSNNAGWQASVAGKDVGGSQLVNGYANGWLVHPTSHDFTVTLTWQPQQRVWIALIVSGFALLLCLVLAIAGRRRSRSALDAAGARDVAPDVVPRVASPFVAAGAQPSAVAIATTTILAVAVSGFVSRWWVGLVVGAAVLLSLLQPRARALLAVGAPVALAICGLYEVVQQYRWKYFPTFEWPKHFDNLNDVAWIAILLFAADALVEIVRRRAARDSGSPGDEVPDQSAPGQGAPSDGVQPPDTPATVPARG